MPRLLSVREFPRAILHIDGDAFFVGVETAKNPSLRGKLVVTGRERGIVSALSYEAKDLGIIRGLPIFEVRRKYPEVIVLPSDYDSYTEYSQKMFDIVRRYTEEVEEYSIDECFADLTGWRRPLKMTYEEILRKIKSDIREELDLSVSVGLAPTKVLAKVASKFRKPDGLTLIPGNLAHQFLAQTPIEKIWGIGPSTSRFLVRKNIKTAYDFALRDQTWIRYYLSKPYEEIWNELNCRMIYDINPLPKTTYKSISETRTFSPPRSEPNFLFQEISAHLENVSRKARHYNLRAKKISFFLKTGEFQFISSEIILPSPSHLPSEILPLLRYNFPSIYREKVLYRATGVVLIDLVSSSIRQSDLFGDIEKKDKIEKVYREIDSLEEKTGLRSVFLASSLKKKENNIIQRKRVKSIPNSS